MTTRKPRQRRADGVANSFRVGTNKADPTTAAATNKQTEQPFDELIATLLRGLGAAEKDDAAVRRLHEFVVRLYSEPVRQIGMALPASGRDSDEARAAFWFYGEPTYSRFYVTASTDGVRDLVIEIALHWGCPVQPGRPWDAEAGA